LVKQFLIKIASYFSAKSIWGILFLFAFSGATAQSFYSTKPDYLKVKNENNNLLNIYSAAYPDTSISDIHNFFPRSYLGNIGLPSPNYTFNCNTNALGFHFYPSAQLNDMFTESQVSYYRSKGPYAALTGIAGSKQLQVFKLLFTHTYQDRVNITLKFNRYTSQGFYLKQQTFTNNFILSSNYYKPDQRAGYYFYFLNNGNKNLENGGLSSDTLNDSLLKFNKALLPVKITSSLRHNKEYKAMLNPWIKLNKAPDSLNKLNSYIQVKSKFAFNSYVYKDSYPLADGFYNLMYHDTVNTYDSSRVMQVSNEINYSVLKGDKSIGASVGYRNEINRVWQKRDSLFLNDIITGDIFYRKQFVSPDSGKNFTAQFENKFNAQYIIKGANAQNYKIENRMELDLSSRAKIFLNLMAENRSPDYIYNYWVSNNFTWFNNGYKPQQMQQAQVGFIYNKRMGVSVLLQNIKDYLFFDIVAMPGQLDSPVQNAGITAWYSSVFFKHLGLSLQNTFQSSSTSFISVPQNISTVKLFYAGSLYKNNLQLNIGFQGQAYQSFFGYAYMPATQVFYLQDRRATGTYPFVDFYLTARIRPVSVFVKVENVLFGYAGSNYALVPGYYQPDRAFRFGINWMFFD